MSDKPNEASMVDRAREFEKAIWGADRVLVEKRNALGEMDVQTFSGAEARLMMPLPTPDNR